MANQSNSLTRKNCLGVILAGGQSTRMGGGDKFMMPVGQTTMLDLVLESFKPQISNIIISTNGDPTRLKNYPYPLIEDTIKNYAGPLAGILAAMQWAKENSNETTHLISVAADTPFFPPTYVEMMIEHAKTIKPESIILAKSNQHYHPIFGLWPLCLETDLKTALMNGTHKIRAWVNAHNNSSVTFPNRNINNQSVDPFFNVNEPKDYQTLQTLINP